MDSPPFVHKAQAQPHADLTCSPEDTTHTESAASASSEEREATSISSTSEEEKVKSPSTTCVPSTGDLLV